MEAAKEGNTNLTRRRDTPPQKVVFEKNSSGLLQEGEREVEFTAGFRVTAPKTPGAPCLHRAS